MSSFAVIIPCFNEEKRLNQHAFLQFAQLHTNAVIFFVDDGSTDKTIDVIDKMRAKANNMQLIRLPRNKGKGEAVRQGVISALDSHSFSYIGYLDADLSTSFDEFYELFIRVQEQDADFIFASRIKKLGSRIERSFLRHIIGRLLVTLIDKKFRLGYYDTQCGAKFFKSSLLEKIVQQPFYTKWFFDIEIFLRLKKLTKSYVGIEYPLKEWHNTKGSKINLLSFPSVSREIFVLFSKY